MKRTLYALIFIFSLSYANAIPKKNPIPKHIQGYISLHYPDAKRVHWMVHEGLYIVSLWASNIHVEICLNEKGEYENSLKEILFYEELPAKVQTTVDIRNLTYAEKLESRHGELFWIVEVSLPLGQVEEKVFDKHGKEIKDYIVQDEQKEGGKEDVLKF